MKIMKKRFLHLMIWLMLLTTTLSAMVGVSYASGGPGYGSAKADVNGYEFTYTWDSTYIKNKTGLGVDQSDTSAAASVEYSDKGFKLTATSSIYRKGGWGKRYYAQDVKTDCTITNTSGKTLEVTYECEGVTVTGAAESDTVVLENNQQLLSCNILADTEQSNETAVNVKGEVRIKSAEEIKNYDLTLNPSSYASYEYSAGTISGNIARNGNVEKVPVDSGAAVTLAATLDSAYTSTHSFYGWMVNGKKVEGESDGTRATLNLTMTTAYDIFPIFLPNEAVQNGGPFLVDSTRYALWGEAIQAALSGGKTVILAENYTLPTSLEANGLASASPGFVEGTDGAITYVVPSGITFLIPYDSTNSTGVRDVKAEWTTENSATGPYKTLTVPQGQTIRVQGTFQVNARVSAQQGGTYNGVVNGTYGKMVLDGTLDIRSGATLYARGYIVASDHTTHDNNSTLGHVEVASGANVHMPLQMLDYRGGSCSASVGENVFPVSNYYFQNIMVSATYQAGAKLYGQWVMRVKLTIEELGYEKDFSQEGESLLLASSGDAMFLNTSGSVTTNYQYKGDRLIINVDGPVTVNRMKVTAKVYIFNYSMDTDGKPVPFNNVTINIRDGGSVTSAKPMKLVPGAEIVVQKGGTFTESDGIYLYQQDAFQARWYHNSTIGRLRLGAAGLIENAGKTVKETDAKITVAGTMNITGSGTIWESSAHSRGVVGVGGGTISFASVPAVNATTTIYEVNGVNSTAEESTGWRPVTGLLAGLSASASDNQKFAKSGAGTYYAKDLLNNPNNAAWYQYTISVQDGKPGLAAVDTSTNFDNDYTTSDTVIGYSVNGGSFYVNAPGRKAENVSLTVDGTALPPDANGVYTVSNITGNKTIGFAFRVAERTSAPNVWYETLQKAVADYDGNGYIRMIENSKEPGFGLTRDVYLDLCGQTVTLDGSMSGTGKLYGMDSSVTDYTSTPKGKLTCSGETVSTITESSPTGEYYVAIPNKDKSVSFHRYNIFVSGYRFELDRDYYKDENGAEHALGALIFQATLEGNDAVADHMADVSKENNIYPFGFTLNGVPLQGTKTGDNSSWNAATKQFEAYWRGYVTKDNIATDHTAQAWVTFKDGKTKKSVTVKLSYLEALQNADYANNVEGIKAFLKKMGQTEQDPATTGN